VKRAFNIAVNADTEIAGIRAIAQEIGGEGAHAKARELLETIKARHTPIAGFFGSGAGLRLQRHDADLAERVVLHLLGQGILVLPVHDSFIVQRRHASARDEVMDTELEKLLASLGARKNFVGANLYDNMGPHNGGGWRPGLPPLLILVGERAFGFGGLAPFSVPEPVLAGWTRGVAPEPVRMALRHELVARGLTQERLARKIGLSRPRLTNLLVGRSGTSPEVATRLKAFLLDAA
jgi:hypothetical protein